MPQDSARVHFVENVEFRDDVISRAHIRITGPLYGNPPLI